jgi:hypothetical protein
VCNEKLGTPPKDCMTWTVVGLAWSNESQSYASGSVATGRVPMPDWSVMKTQTKKQSPEA